jgi:hypothetical protein
MKSEPPLILLPFILCILLFALLGVYERVPDAALPQVATEGPAPAKVTPPGLRPETRGQKEERVEPPRHEGPKPGAAAGPA